MPSNHFDVTAANAECIMTIEEIAPAGVVLEMFSVDNAITADAIDMTETRKGVDGKMVAGVVKNVYSLTINLEASSPTAEVFERYRDALQRHNIPYQCQLTIYFPATGKTVTYVNGVLKNGPIITNMGRTLQPTSWRFDFEEVQA